ncbi:serine/threonine-protein kinase TOR [Iris pallida]|uniref:Serine/threonine-protein kinase TOR n=1 Tax=Iris pallida TaxID=29817 RepID=A0AAX6G9N2_IRIPA|nr:serine/threonine-protein kinase TOR [Iris pallida]
MDQLYERISYLFDISEVTDNLGALPVVDELINVTLAESASKVSQFSSYMKTIFEAKRDPEVLILT